MLPQTQVKTIYTIMYNDITLFQQRNTPAQRGLNIYFRGYNMIHTMCMYKYRQHTILRRIFKNVVWIKFDLIFGLWLVNVLF